MRDRKFKNLAINPCKGTIYTEENSILFCAQDKALLPTLAAYKKECEKLGCGPEHIESITLLSERIAKFQESYTHIPDTETDCEIDRCIGGNV